jgi:aldose 1-epimerase
MSAAVTRRPFGALAGGEGVDAYTLTNERGTEMCILSYGGAIVSLRVADRHDALGDVVLGYDTLDGYVSDERFLGVLIGRYANRIAGGCFTIDGVQHSVTQNEGRHHLHGGRGFHHALWDVEPFVASGGAGATLAYVSPAGDDGYPGTVRVRVRYTLRRDDALVLDYSATADDATPLNLTQHLYFNLAGHDAGPVSDHELTLSASRFTPVDAELIPTGELRDVRGTPFDFTTPCAVGARIGAPDAQLRCAGGYDHNFVIDGAAPGALTFAARLHEPRSGRMLELFTTEPGVQFYSGNHLATGAPGKGGCRYARYGGLALETQHFPDSPNRPEFPSTVLRPGRTYRSHTVYRFSAPLGAGRKQEWSHGSA